MVYIYQTNVILPKKMWFKCYCSFAQNWECLKTAAIFPGTGNKNILLGEIPVSRDKKQKMELVILNKRSKFELTIKLKSNMQLSIYKNR